MEILNEVNNALNFVKQKKYKQAEIIYKKLLTTDPNNSILLSFLGFLYLTTKKYKQAEKIFNKAYLLSQSETIISGLALSKYLLNKKEESIFLYEQLVKIFPKYEYYEKLTSALSHLVSFGKSEYTYDCYRYSEEANKKFPLNKQILLNLSVANIYSGNFKQGEKYCLDALKLDKKYADALEFLGFIKEGIYLDDSLAQVYYKKSIKYGNKLSGYFNLAVSYSKIGKHKLATLYFNKALKLSPSYNTIIRDKAYNYLKQRDFKKGYKLFVNQTESELVKSAKNSWNGKSSKDKTILVISDLCYGDQILFSRYLPFLKNKFKKVKVHTYPNLIELFKQSFDGIDFISNINVKYDYSVALSRLPYYLKMDFNNIPFSDKYLKINKKEIKSNKLKIGLCWEAGNSDLRNTIHRSISINMLSKLFDLDCDFYSFQVGSASKDYLKYNITDLGSSFNSFADTAQYLQAMDIVISVDTSVANLAGALGIKTFMLLPYYSDWRWFDNIEKTEWYESIKIFKQVAKLSWQNEIECIYNELTKLI